MDDVLVIGGGAAGMIAAWRAAALGARTRLLEKNAQPGLKIHISGGGKCNITHAGLIHDVRMAFEPNEARFLRPAFQRFTNDDVMKNLEGVALVIAEAAEQAAPLSLTLPRKGGGNPSTGASLTGRDESLPDSRQTQEKP